MLKTMRYFAGAGVLSVAGAVASFGTADADGGGNMTATISPGVVSVSGGNPGSFSGTLNGSQQYLGATLGTYTILNNAGATGKWAVDLQATQFSCTGVDAGCPSGGAVLPYGSLTPGHPTIQCHASVTCGSPPTEGTPSQNNSALDTGGAVATVASDTDGSPGVWDVTTGNNANSKQALSLSIPATGVYATTYHSVLTITVIPVTP